MKKAAIITYQITDLKTAGKNFGGGAVVTSRLISELSKMQDIDLSVVVMRSDNPGEENYKISEYHPEIYGSVENFIKAAYESLKEENYSFVVTANTEIPGPNNLLQGHSFIHRINNAPLLIRPVKILFSFNKLKKQKNILKKHPGNGKYIAVSKKIKNDYTKNFNIPEENITVIYPGCKQPEEYPIPEYRRKAKLGIAANTSMNKGGHLFLLAAGIAKLFGANFRIKMIAPLFEKDPILRFLTYIFGLKESLEILPKLDDMTGFYRDIDYIMLPSLNEAFGLVALEASSFGKPSLVSSTTGFSEILSPESGFVFNRKSLISFVKSIIKICKIYEKDFGTYLKYSKNASEMSKEYSWENFAKNVLKNATIEEDNNA